MSLIHWWPLNGNTNDYGVNNIALINNGATVNSAGKIGKCYSFSNNNMVVATSDIMSATELSLCLWLKLSTSHSGYAQVLVLGTSGTSWNNIRCGIDINGDGRIYFNVSSGSANTYIYSPLNYKDNIWHHITGIYNNGSLQLYIDGIQVAAGTTTNVPGLSGTSIYVGGNAGGEKANNGDCLNDVRIYNHALSAKEVKEISKGLVLHYNFEDPYIEPTTNLLPENVRALTSTQNAYFNGTREITTVDGFKCLAVTNNTSNSYGDGVIFNGVALTDGTTYTASAKIKTPTAVRWSIRNNNNGGYSTTKTINGNDAIWQDVSITFTASASNSSTSGVLECVETAANTTSYTWYIKDIQIEAKDHATPYVNGTRSAGKVYDNSGYGYNGTIAGKPQITSDSTIGKHSMYSPSGANYVERQNFPIAGFNADQRFTINAWIKIVGYNGSNWNTIFRLAATNAQYQQLHWCYKSSGDINLSHYGDDPQFTLNVPLNTWAMVTWVHYTEDSVAKCQYFVNGQQVGSTQSYSGLLNIQDNARLTLFYDSIRRGYDSDLYIGDFKIYSTVLSAEDILAEYNRKAAIDKNGNLFTGEIIETAGSATKIDKNSFIDSNLFATTMTLEDGSVWAPICIHYVPDGLFTGANKTFYYTGRNVWTNFGAINDLVRPESNQWEFYVMQQSTVGGPFSKYRFKQNVSPLSATWEQVNPSKVGTNVTRISATATNSYAGMYWYNTSYIAMCFANGSNGNWFGCGARAYWGTGYTPGYNGEQVRGWQLVYMRISEHKARMFKNGIMIPTDIIEN